MKIKIALIAVAIVILSVSLYYFKNAQVTLDKSGELNLRLGGIFSKFGLQDSNLIKKYVEEKKMGSRRYLNTYREYNARRFSGTDFENALKQGLEKTGFRIQKTEQFVVKDAETFIFKINFARYDILTIRVNKVRPPAVPSGLKKYKNPRVAIVMDDFGYNMNNVDSLFEIGEPVTLSILPNLTYSRKIANFAKSKGYETILHLPLESHRKDVKEEIDTIRSGMSETEVTSMLDREIASVPGLSGVSNHMGSKATEDMGLMTTIFKELRKRKLYFLD
ncbi:MAG: hypothetical protein A2987_06020, partial [Omnitrophica bacterium RIFCSPLOWO2_01_FULL_45_10]